MFSNITQ